ncbi:MAG: hypothetical protein V4719_14570 [Planctomycetota bacterium]
MFASRLLSSLLLGGLLAVTGCGTPKPAPLSPAEPLTVEEWRDLEPAEKYDPATFDRLKLNDPKLQSEPAWDKFMRDVVLPERKLDIPSTPDPGPRKK